MKTVTPVRSQYLRIKQAYPEAIVLFRLGDFYETFDEDAKLAARELEITLTSREMGKGHRVPMAGIPYHALDGYLARLVGRGHKVAICEQLSPAGRGLVERDVVRVVTPGTVVEPGLLETRVNNYLVSLVPGGDEVGIAYVDITTSEFATSQLPLERAGVELERLRPAEVLTPGDSDYPLPLPVPVTPLEEPWFELETARRLLADHFGVTTLEGFGCEHLPLAIRAAGSILHYLERTQKGVLGQLSGLSTYSTESFMTMDGSTRRHLELFGAGRQGGASGSLLSIMDLTRTAMGGRLLRRWLGQPLLDLARLERRQGAVAWFHAGSIPRGAVIALLGEMADLERLTNRVRSAVALPRELVALRRALEAVPRIRDIIEEAEPLGWLVEDLGPCRDIVELIAGAIAEEPAEGAVIRPGFSPELDELRESSRGAKDYLAGLERKERERTAIKSLKVGFNHVFGYYIEVSNPNLPQVPAEYIRKQTLVGGERFFTPELKEYESKILHAQERIDELEASLFRRVCAQVGASGERLLSLAGALARVDVLSALAEVAVRNVYIRPELADDDRILIVGGRHPVVEQSLLEEGFVPNDTDLSNGEAQLVVLTGPNMAGKSTYMRQVALIVLMAQIGSFVPAGSAHIGLVDRIFTRVGLMDDIAAGQSTFMIEMVETANILNNATPRSLIILDEIGRGTSTYDGISIARAVAEYIHNSPRLGAKTLFATHYHEMVGLAQYLPRVRNFNVAVMEEGDRVVFLHKIVPGGSDRSYGIHVAQMAGLPRAVIGRAEEVLGELEGDRGGSGQAARGRRPPARPSPQLPLFGEKSPLLEELAKLDVDSLTPLEAITKLYELKKKLGEPGR
ncbi:MAG: DNA mismatch repair protein MutS [Dehalococcoidia bacterium]